MKNYQQGRNTTLYFFLVLSFNLFSQVKIHSEIKISDKYQPDSIIWDISDQTLVYINKPLSYENTVTLKKLNINHNKTEEIILPIPRDSLLQDESDDVIDIAYDAVHNLLGILTWEKIFFIDLEKMLYSQEWNKKYTEIRTLGDKTFLLIKMYNHHPLDSKDKFVLSIYDVSKNKFISKKSISYDDIAYTMLVHSFVDVFNDKIIYSHSLTPKMYVLNKNLDIIDSVLLYFPEFQKNIFFQDESQYSLDKNNPKELYVKLKRMDTVNYRIEKIFFNNDTSIILSIRPPNSGFQKREIYILVKTKENNWQVYKKWLWIKDIKYNKDIMFFDFTFSAQLKIKNGYVYFQYYSNNPVFFKKTWNSIYDYIYEKNYKKVSLYIYTFTL